jgi:hypothetical protein
MSEKKFKFGLFNGGDPRTFQPDKTTATEEQINAWRFDCEWWNLASADGLFLSDFASQAVPHEIEMSDCANSIYGGGFFEVSPEPAAEMTEEVFNEILNAPPQKLPFRAVLG